MGTGSIGPCSRYEGLWIRLCSRYERLWIRLWARCTAIGRFGAEQHDLVKENQSGARTKTRRPVQWNNPKQIANQKEQFQVSFSYVPMPYLSSLLELLTPLLPHPWLVLVFCFHRETINSLPSYHRFYPLAYSHAIYSALSLASTEDCLYSLC